MDSVIIELDLRRYHPRTMWGHAAGFDGSSGRDEAVIGSPIDRPGDGRLILLVVLAAAALASLAVVRYLQLNNGGYDTAIYGNTLWRLAHGFSGESAITGIHLFTDHVPPLLLLFVPIFRFGIDVGICSLLVAGAISLGLVGFAVLRLGRLQRLDEKLLFFFVAITMLGPGTVLVSQFGFHDTTLGLGPLAMTIVEGMNPRRHRLWWCWPLLAAFSRQEIAAAVIVAGLLLWRSNRRAAVTVVAIGGGVLAAAVVWLLAISSVGSMAGYHFAHLGATPSEILRGAIRDPGAALAPVFDRMAVASFVVWLLPFGLIAVLRAWRWLLVAFPLVAIPVFGTWAAADSYWEHYWHILLVPAALGSVLGFGLLSDWWRRLYPLLTVALLVLTWVLWAPDLGGVFDVSADPTARAVYQEASAAPDAALSTSPGTLARLSGRKTVMVFPRPFLCLQDTFGYFEGPPAPPDMVVSDARLEDRFSVGSWDRITDVLDAAYEPQAIDADVTIWRMVDPIAAAERYEPCTTRAEGG